MTSLKLFVALLIFASPISHAQNMKNQRVAVNLSDFTCEVSTPTDKMILNFAEEYDEMIQIRDGKNHKSYIIASNMDSGRLSIDLYDSTAWAKEETDAPTLIKTYEYELTEDLKIEIQAPAPYKLKVSCPFE